MPRVGSILIGIALVALTYGVLSSGGHLTVAEVIAIAALLANIGIGLVSRPRGFIAPSLDHGSNPRFGFGFAYPSTWARNDPLNNDGHTFTDTENQAVRYLVYGRWSTGPLGSPERASDDDSLLTAASEEIREDIRKKRCRLLSSLLAGTWLVGAARPKEPMRRCFFKYGCGKTLYLHTIAVHDRVEFHIECEAPKNVFDRYQDLFLALISNFVIFDQER